MFRFSGCSLSVLSHCELNLFGFWTVGRTKRDTWRRVGLWDCGYLLILINRWCEYLSHSGLTRSSFRLCFSGLETKASVLRALRSLLRDRAPVGSLRRTRLSTAERSSSWRRRQQRCRSDTQRTTHHQPEESCRPDGSFILGETCSEPLLPSHASGSAGKRTRLCSLTSELEAQLQRLNFTEEESERGAAASHSDDRRNEEERRSSSLRRSPGGEVLDFSSLLERDFSVQSMTSMVNEDCFYDSMLGVQKAAVPTLQG